LAFSDDDACRKKEQSPLGISGELCEADEAVLCLEGFVV